MRRARLAFKKAVLEYAKACRSDAESYGFFEVPKSTFYHCKHHYVREEVAGLAPKKPAGKHWAKLSRCGTPGRPAVSREARDLIRRMSTANPPRGALRIVDELGKIGIEAAKSTVEWHMVRRRMPPSPTWRAFLRNHIQDLIAVDFFVVPTVRNQVLFVFRLLAHERRRVLHFNVSANPTATWTAQQIVEAFPWQNPPKHFLRYLDRIYGPVFRQRVVGLGFEEVGGLHHPYERNAA